jgi:hypothetical protein
MAAPLPPIPSPVASPAVQVATVIDATSVPTGRGFVAAPNAKTAMHDVGTAAADAVLTPPHVQSFVPPPSANPAGAMVNVELPLPAHLIGLPPIEQAFTTDQQNVIEQRARKVPPWLLPVLFVVALSVALGLAIAIGRAVR